MKMEVTESTNSNPSTKVKSRDLLIFQLGVIIDMKYKGNNAKPRIDKAFQLLKEGKVILYEDNSLRARVEGNDTYYTNLSANTCTCMDKAHNLEKEELCKHLWAHKFAHDIEIGVIKLEGVQ